MKAKELIIELLALLEGSLEVHDGKAVVKDAALLKWRIHKLAVISALESGPRKGIAQYLIRLAAQASGIFPASIHELYKARGRGEIPSTFTVPAMNLRAMTFDAARVVFRVANDWNGMAFIFEIARSEMGYTDQPAEKKPLRMFSSEAAQRCLPLRAGQSASFDTLRINATEK